VPVLHFFQLTHLLREQAPGGTVRVEAAARRLPAEPPRVRVAFEVYARGATGGDLLSWMLRTGEYMAEGAEPDDAALEPFFAANEAEAERVRQFIADQGYNVQRGLIDLHGAEPLPGAWHDPGLRAWAQPAPVTAR
jgi:hypothetical protein